MASNHEYLIWKRNVGGDVYPDVAAAADRRSPINTITPDGGPETIQITSTDSRTRAMKPFVLGGKNFTASLGMDFHPTGLVAHLLRSLFSTVAATEIDVGLSWRNDMLPTDNDNQLGWLKMQAQYRSTYAVNYKGMVLNTFNISQALNDKATVAATFTVNDIAPSDQNFSDGNPSPSVIALGTTTIEDPLPNPFVHFQAQLVQGGTLTKTGDEITLVGGTSTGCLQSVEVAFTLNTTPIHCISFGDGTNKNTYNAVRAITVSTDHTWYQENSDFWLKMRNGTQTALQLTFESSEVIPTTSTKYRYNFVFPYLQIPQGQANLPELTGSKELRIQGVQFEAKENPDDSVFGGDVALSITTSENLTN